MAKNKKNQPKPLKKSAITLAEFRSSHFLGKGFNTDMYYVGFANTLYPILKKMIGENSKFSDAAVRDLVLNLVCYLEDLVSQTGVWEAFVSLHKKKYGREMPFFDTDDEYYSREFPCVQAICFLIWFTLNGYSSDTFLNPCNPFTRIMAEALTPMLMDAYDNAPDTPGRPKLLSEDELKVPLFYQIRNICYWLCTRCYLTRIRDTESISRQLEAVASDFFGMEDTSYIKEAYLSFNTKIGPLGIKPQEWLAEILELYPEEGENQFIHLVKGLESLPYSIYTYREVRKDGAILGALNGDEMNLSAYTMPNLEMPSGVAPGGSAFMSLVLFDGQWMLNGLGMQGAPAELYQKARENWLKNREDRKCTYDLMFKRLKKKRIGICSGYDDYISMFPEIDRERFMNVPDDIKNCENLLYFLNSDSTLTFLPEWGRCVKLRGNKFYDKKEAEKDALCLILDHDLTTPEMRSCLIDNNLVPDAALNSLESVNAGKTLFQNNIRFLNDYVGRDGVEVFSEDMNLADEK